MLDTWTARWIRADAAAIVVLTLWTVSYGLKLPTGFEYTALGPIGRARTTSGGT